MSGQVLDVVLTIGRVEHLWCVVRILLLSHAHVDSNVSIAKSVILESDLELILVGDPLETRKRQSQSDTCMYHIIIQSSINSHPE